MTSPAAIVLTGLGAAVGVVTGLGPIGAVALGAGGWAARVGASLATGGGRRREPDVDPSALREPWRTSVQRAIDSRERFEQAVSRADDGPLTRRLQEIADRLDVGVRESWRIASSGQTIEDARRYVDVNAIAERLRGARDDVVRGRHSADAKRALEGTVASLEAQLHTVKRMDSVLADTDARLRLLDARLSEAATRAIELSVRAHDPSDLAGLGEDVDVVVTDLESLRLALDETDQATGQFPG
ncbi:MAG: hypothetical protein S0880_07855 [Actinomycetota bacterium]|nr:hypothetical protein [Actinomycetota bacterium]